MLFACSTEKTCTSLTTLLIPVAVVAVRDVVHERAENLGANGSGAVHGISACFLMGVLRPDEQDAIALGAEYGGI